jgi:hypothetical protein
MHSAPLGAAVWPVVIVSIFPLAKEAAASAAALGRREEAPKIERATFGFGDRRPNGYPSLVSSLEGWGNIT